MNGLYEKVKSFFSEKPEWLWFLLILGLLFLLYRAVTKWMVKTLADRKIAHSHSVIVVWRILFSLLVALVMLSMVGQLGNFGISAAFLGMLLGWGLQAPVTGLAAWLLVIWLQPFKVGDRVVLAGIIGDVRHIGLMYITLEQVGGTIGGEETSGRAILLPTAVLFGQVITNYRLDKVFRAEHVEEQLLKKKEESDGFILDEVPIRITFETDWDAAKKIMTECAAEVTRDIIAKTGKKPFIRAEFLDWGIMIRLRYWTRTEDRQMISSNIVEKIFKAFHGRKDVEFAYPHSEIIYSPKDQPKA